MTIVRFLVMLAERGLSPHWFASPGGQLCVNIGKDDKMVGHYSESFILDLTEKQMEVELDKISHPNYEWTI